MTFSRLVVAVTALLAGSAALSPSDAFAQAYPVRPIRMVVPFAAGGSTDVVARIVAQGMSGPLGQPVVVENKPGAGGSLGSETVARAEPDGYTILVATVSTHAINPALYTKLSFDVIKDFAAITHLVDIPNVLVIAKDLPGTVKDFTAYARANAGKLNYASPGSGSIGHLQGHWFAALSKADMTHIPYRGAGPAMQDLLGGQVQLMIDNVPTSLSHIRAGTIKALLVSSSERIAQLPDVPSAPEAGFPDFIGFSWAVLLAPAKTPASVVNTLHEAAAKTLADPVLRTRLTDLSATAVGSGPEAATRHIAAELAKWAPIVRATGVTLD